LYAATASAYHPLLSDQAAHVPFAPTASRARRQFLLPWLCYRWAVPQWGETAGLIASSLPPLLWSGIELLRFRRIDALSLLVLAGILLSLAGHVAGWQSACVADA
jgi:hypothetical protein